MHVCFACGCAWFACLLVFAFLGDVGELRGCAEFACVLGVPVCAVDSAELLAGVVRGAGGAWVCACSVGG